MPDVIRSYEYGYVVFLAFDEMANLNRRAATMNIHNEDWLTDVLDRAINGPLPDDDFDNETG